MDKLYAYHVVFRASREFMGRLFLSLVLLLSGSLPSIVAEAQVAPCPPVLGGSFGSSGCNASRGVDWYPGHYLMSFGHSDGTATFDWSKIDGTAAAPYFMGGELYLPWGLLETGQGQYNWRYLEGHLRDAASLGKKLIIGIHMFTFNGPANRRLGCPADLDAAGHCWFQKSSNPEHCDAEFAFLADRHGPKIWNSQVALDRAKAFYAALGARYNDDERVAGVYVYNGESAIGICNGPQKSSLGFDIDDYIDARIEVMKAAREAFPNKVLLHGLNGSQRGGSDMYLYAAGMEADAIGTVQPDFANASNPSDAQQYVWPEFLDVLPIAQESQRSTQGCRGMPDTSCRFGEPDENYLRAMHPDDGGEHGVNFLIWPWHWENHYLWDFEDEVVPVVKARMDAGDTLNTNCPTAFDALGGCNTE